MSENSGWVKYVVVGIIAIVSIFAALLILGIIDLSNIQIGGGGGGGPAPRGAAYATQKQDNSWIILLVLIIAIPSGIFGTVFGVRAWRRRREEERRAAEETGRHVTEEEPTEEEPTEEEPTGEEGEEEKEEELPKSEGKVEFSVKVIEPKDGEFQYSRKPHEIIYAFAAKNKTNRDINDAEIRIEPEDRKKFKLVLTRESKIENLVQNKSAIGYFKIQSAIKPEDWQELNISISAFLAWKDENGADFRSERAIIVLNWGPKPKEENKLLELKIEPPAVEFLEGKEKANLAFTITNNTYFDAKDCVLAVIPSDKNVCKVSDEGKCKIDAIKASGGLVNGSFEVQSAVPVEKWRELATSKLVAAVYSAKEPKEPISNLFEILLTWVPPAEKKIIIDGYVTVKKPGGTKAPEFKKRKKSVLAEVIAYTKEGEEYTQAAYDTARYRDGYYELEIGQEILKGKEKAHLFLLALGDERYYEIPELQHEGDFELNKKYSIDLQIVLKPRSARTMPQPSYFENGHTHLFENYAMAVKAFNSIKNTKERAKINLNTFIEKPVDFAKVHTSVETNILHGESNPKLCFLSFDESLNNIGGYGFLAWLIDSIMRTPHQLILAARDKNVRKALFASEAIKKRVRSRGKNKNNPIIRYPDIRKEK